MALLGLVHHGLVVQPSDWAQSQFGSSATWGQHVCLVRVALHKTLGQAHNQQGCNIKALIAFTLSQYTSEQHLKLYGMGCFIVLWHQPEC